MDPFSISNDISYNVLPVLVVATIFLRSTRDVSYDAPLRLFKNMVMITAALVSLVSLSAIVNTITLFVLTVFRLGYFSTIQSSNQNQVLVATLLSICYATCFSLSVLAGRHALEKDSLR